MNGMLNSYKTEIIVFKSKYYVKTFVEQRVQIGSFDVDN